MTASKEIDAVKNQDDLEDTKPVRGENIVVRPGTAIAFLCGNATLLGIAIWWAASLQSDVRNVQRDVITIRTAVASLDRIAAIEVELRELRQYGSDNARKNAADIMELRKEFEMHKVRDENGKGKQP